MRIQTFTQAQQFLFTKIPHSRDLQFPGTLGLQRTKHFLKLLKNPQEKYRTIHIAGTSGKGSTAAMVTSLLKASGKIVGTHLSPYVYDIRERVQINNALISEKKFVHYLNEIVPAIKQCEKSRFGKPTYFEILTALAFYAFYKEGVDCAVVETGLGGIYDATNTIRRKDKICVITRIGKDHTRILGNSYAQIAAQKAGIIHRGNIVITIQQNLAAQTVIQRTAQKNKARLFVVDSKKDISDIHITEKKTAFTLNAKPYTLNLIGAHQAENASLALSLYFHLFPKQERTAHKALSTVKLPGRFELHHMKGKRVILDAAHNPQKMQALVKTLQTLYPSEKFYFLLAFKKGKDFQSMLNSIMPVASHITVTSFFQDSQDLIHISEDPKTVCRYLRKNKFMRTNVMNDSDQAYKYAIAKSKKILIITGSLYFLSEMSAHMKK